MLRAQAQRQPTLRAYSIGRSGGWVHHTTGELEAVSDALAYQLASEGVVAGQRVLVLVPPGFELFALVFAVMKLGAVPVLIDLGAGLEAVQRCLEDTHPTVMISNSAGHLLRLVRPRAFASIQRNFSLGRFGGRRLVPQAEARRGSFPLEWPPAPSPAAILFTSGSTGTPKGCRYSHAQFEALVHSLRTELRYVPESADLTTFPVLGLFAPVLGGTSVLPEMNFGRPSRAKPRHLLEAASATGCSTIFGSTQLIEAVCLAAQADGQSMPVSRLMLAGAPPSFRLLGCVQGSMAASANLPNLVIPFGSTECLLVSVGESSTLPAPGPLGVCVGRPIAGHVVRIIALREGPIDRWHEGLELAPGQVGEITVKGPLVSDGYEGRPDLTALAKIDDGGEVVHRLGDLGALDEQGRLWVAGRTAHRVGEVLPLVVESMANAEPGVRRSALVNVRGEPWVLLELMRGARGELVRARVEARVGGAVKAVRVVTAPFPVDRRHEVKIDRLTLSAQWSRRARSTP